MHSPEIGQDHRTYTDRLAGATIAVNVAHLAECDTLDRHHLRWWHEERLERVSGPEITRCHWTERTERCHRAPPHRLLQHRVHVWQRRPIFKVWQSLPVDDTIDLCLCTTLDLGMVHHEIDEYEKRGIGLFSLDITP